MDDFPKNNQRPPIKRPLAKPTVYNPQQKINFVASALKLRQKGINPSTVVQAQKSLDKLDDKNLTQSQKYQRLSTNQRNSYYQFANEIPTGLLNKNIPMKVVQPIVQRLKAAKAATDKAQADAEMLAAKKQLEENSQKSILPAVLNLKRIGIRSFPDGRTVAMYQNKELGLLFTIPYGNNEEPGPIVPSNQSISEGTLEYHVDKAEEHHKNGLKAERKEDSKTKQREYNLRDYHLSLAKHRSMGLKNSKKNDPTITDQKKKLTKLKAKISEREKNNFDVEDDNLKNLHSKLKNAKNKQLLQNLIKTNPRKAIEIDDRLVASKDKKPNTTK